MQNNEANDLQEGHEEIILDDVNNIILNLSLCCMMIFKFDLFWKDTIGGESQDAEFDVILSIMTEILFYVPDFLTIIRNF